MSPDAPLTSCDLAVVGAGMAGMCATLFAANRGLSTVAVGGTGEIVHASGLMDLLAVHPVAERRIWLDPWSAIDTLVKDIPKHPYALLRKREIRAALDEVLATLERAGLPYRQDGERNCQVLTSVGTLKTTYGVPLSMWNGVLAWQRKPHCLLVDFAGMKSFSARQIAETLQQPWPRLRATRIRFPRTEDLGEVTPEYAARALDRPECRRELAEALRLHLHDAQTVGLPAVLGFHRSRDVVTELEERLGVPVFEVPTTPVSVPGLRLQEAFTRQLCRQGVRWLSHRRVVGVKKGPDDVFSLTMGGRDDEPLTVRARGIILATGRFLGQGLRAERDGIRETLLDLPVVQPQTRSEWHQPTLLDPRGNPVNQAGLEVDELFRPLGADRRPAFARLFAAGSILAHQDWMRMKCGSGLAVATASAAVNAFLHCRDAA